MNLIANLPNCDDVKLRLIEENANRLSQTGTAVQKTQAAEALAVIATERERRQANNPKYQFHTTSPAFEAVWSLLTQRLKQNTSIQNWSAYKDFTGGEFKVEDVSTTALRVSGSGMKMPRNISNGDFCKVYQVWEDYRTGNLSRGELTKLSQNTTYIFSIFHHIGPI